MSLLFTILLRLHILLPPLSPCFTQYPPSAPHRLTPTHSCPCWGPLCTNDPLIMYLRYLAPVKQLRGLVVEGGTAVGEGKVYGARGVVHGLMAIITAQRLM
ncbi:hypothetical protein ILYODFUR_015144 [Ilyodon furcidens]|uniref:Uncharacterized protein n=2 Tax=Goodeidae TaxID=28758 RepID=A0ABV0UI41_9TELE